jgi:hypothetical protein
MPSMSKYGHPNRSPHLVESPPMHPMDDEVLSEKNIKLKMTPLMKGGGGGWPWTCHAMRWPIPPSLWRTRLCEKFHHALVKRRPFPRPSDTQYPVSPLLESRLVQFFIPPSHSPKACNPAIRTHRLPHPVTSQAPGHSCFGYRCDSPGAPLRWTEGPRLSFLAFHHHATMPSGGFYNIPVRPPLFSVLFIFPSSITDTS